MSDETPGVGQGALPPREGQGLRAMAERPAASSATVRVVSGQYVLTNQPHGMPALAQITSGNSNVTRLISISPSRIGQTSPVRPSVAHQSIVDVLTKSRLNSHLNNMFSSGESSSNNVQNTRPLKRPLPSSGEKKDTYASKLQHVMNHRIVRSKLVKEKYNEHLLEAFYLETGNNILDLYQFAKRPKTQAYLTYLKEHAIDPRDYPEPVPSVTIPQTTLSTPSATAASSLPGISQSHPVQTSSPIVTTSESHSNHSTPKSVSVKMKSVSNTNSTSQEMIVEKAKQEAYVVQRIADLQKEGLWSEKRLPKVQEMPRTKAHWDFLLEEMVWLAADFAQERKWKKAAAKKCARMVQKYFQDKALAAQKAEKAHEQNLRRIAAFCSKEIKNFWNNVEKLVEYKQNTILEEKRKKALDQQLSFIVDQTEKYSQLLAEGMNKSVEPPSSVPSRSVSRAHSDTEFDPDLQSDEDDEETIAREEALGNEGHKEEIEALQKESQMELDDLLEDDFLKNYLLNRDKIRLSDSEESDDDVDSKKELSKTDLDEKEPSEESDSSKEDDVEETEEESEDEETKVSEIVPQGEHDELKLLVEDSQKEGEIKTETDTKDDLINDAAAIAESIQPKGNTLSSTNVSTNIPFLLKYSLREYQHIGLDWLVTMFERKLNGILADEMGLGKTIQTIALLAHLACEKENWGPHLIVVPTSVMLNWEMECKKWCPAFKILTYYGTQKERKFKRIGWTKPNAFHICITSYKLVIQDHQSFRRKKWKYLILDEAQNIKNFKSQRWQLLLNFQTQQRLLLTGTPLQNNLMELWSLMHFLMPNVFQSHREFKEWFSNPVTGMIEGNSEYNESIIKRLHKVLRPFLLRRLKSEVEKQMPKKYEHVVMCRLSKRQRYLYDDYMSRAKTRETLASGNLLSVINVLMQLRKVCNHPNLFEVRPTTSPFQCEGIRLHIPSIVYSAIDYDPSKHVNLQALNLLLIMQEIHFGSYQCYRMRQSRNSKKLMELDEESNKIPPPCPPCKLAMRVLPSKVSNTANEEKSDKKNVPVSSQPPPLQLKGFTQPNVKVKVSGVQLVNQQGILKTIPVVNISQGTTGQIGTPVSVTSVLKPQDKISASFAQLVQTSTGKHLLLTSNPNITGNIPVTSTPGGQKLTFLSKQPVATIGNAVTKAFVKFQFTSITTSPTFTTTTTSNSNSIAIVKSEENKVKGVRTPVGNDYIGKLYSKQNNLDVRWNNDDKNLDLINEEDPKGERKNRLALMCRINNIRCSALPLYGRDFQDAVKIFTPNKINPWGGGHIHCLNTLYCKKSTEPTDCLKDILYNPEMRLESLKEIFDRFILYVPAVKAAEPELRVWHPPPSKYWGQKQDKQLLQKLFSKPATPLHSIASAMVTQFPDPRLIQYDCGKLQTLDILLRKLKMDGHRVLIFTQMTKMLDVLEAFLNYHGHIYLRLDGTTRVDQRQVLMERFNGDTRIFAFILSTRSGGVGVNLTGADTVIFYDSDWNPTMDAQAQDRCHRIGQTRDVHIYRLVSERTIEENILKKANQKRMLGDLAIEGGNFTTAYFKSSTIQDLFNIDQNEENAATRMSGVMEMKKERERALSNETSVGDDKIAVGALESALAACEDDQDVQAAKTAKAEAVADLAEFDENIPLDEQEKEPEISKAEQEINNIIEKLTPIEKYAMKFIETTESAWSAEQLAAAAREIEEQKREWEQNRLAAMREEEDRRARELEEENDIITFSREDATNQIWVSDTTMEHMPMWCPPTPPQQENDVYIDQTMAFMYDTKIMSESELPPVYVKREAKRTRLEAGLIENRRALKIPRKEESTNAPKSLFHSATILKMRRDLKLQKYRGLVRPALPVPGKPNIQKPLQEQPLFHEWTIHEDMAILKVIQNFQGLPLNLIVTNLGHTPNWDFVADYVNTVSITYRTPKQCRQRYENHLMQREEGKQLSLEFLKKKKNKSGAIQKYPMLSKSSRCVRTSQLYTQDNNSAFSQTMANRFDALKAISNKKTPATRNIVNNPLLNKTKHNLVLNECGIDIEHPVLPVEVAARRAERIAKEKKNMTAEQQQQLAARLQMMKNMMAASQQANIAAASSVNTPGTSTGTHVAQTPSQIVVTQSTAIVTTTAASVSTQATPPTTLRTQRIIASPIQTSTVVSVSGLSPAQLQAATQRLIVSAGSSGQGKVVATTNTLQGKAIGQAQLAMIRQANLKQQLRLHAGNIPTQGVKTSTVTIGGQQAVVQFTQAQPRAQFIRQGTVTVGGKTGITRTVTESDLAQLLKKQQQKLGTSGGSTIQSLSPQVLAQAIQAGSSGGQVATLVKAVSSPGVTQTVTIPVTGVALSNQGKNIQSTLKTTNATQFRQLQLQQQLLAQKKLNAQKLSIAQVAGKNNVQTQLIVGSKPLGTAMTVQQFQQVIRSPLNVSQGPVVLAKGPSTRVIPVNTAQGTKQTIQVVAASTSQTLNTALRPQAGSSALAGALAGIKVQGTSSASQQALLSQVSAALNQNVTGMRQGSPVRIQTSSGTPLVAVSVQNVQQAPNSSVATGSQPNNSEQVSRYLKK
ncbi:helicase domino isoform X1 [Diorhabda sublineata]|uniref:helicase domino isoform X1 n=1 Tax=Diorhabda sublineata TaxID=1163346 RepID=UPI0024E11353|nr:helicase domino isoform X1 [Diorhabda sublineata]